MIKIGKPTNKMIDYAKNISKYCEEQLTDEIL
jgi:hypothetical protein